jgi:hypothetical protein
MMKFVYRLPYYVYPEKPVAEAPVLLFLHGVGEGFISKEDPLGRQTDGALHLGEIGHRNLLRQGPPKHLKTLPSGHPLLRSFTLVAPQLPDRDTLWGDAVDDVEKILGGHRSDGGKVYIVGFSKGGLGAFQVADRLDATALVTIDASPMDVAPKDAIEMWVKPMAKRPLWAIHTSYAPGERFRKIQEFNELLTLVMHNGISSPPKASAQWRSFEHAPAGKDPVQRHVWICDEATRSEAPYEWLLQH